MTTCNECPYKKDSAPGWLGESSGYPEEFLKQLDLVFLHPCHKAVDWETDDNVMSVLEAPVCKGAIQFAKNICKLLYDYPYEKVRKLLPVDDSVIFGTRHEFIAHHDIHGLANIKFLIPKGTVKNAKGKTVPAITIKNK